MMSHSNQKRSCPSYITHNFSQSYLQNSNSFVSKIGPNLLRGRRKILLLILS